MKHILQLSVKKKGILFTKKILVVIKNLFVELQQLLRKLHIVPGHRIRLASSGFPFQRSDVLAPNLQSNVDVLDRYRTVLDLVTENHPLEVLHGWLTQCIVQSSCDFCTLDFPLNEAFLVLRDSFDKRKMLLLLRVVVMQPTLMHSKLHIWFGLRLPLDHKHQIITTVCDAILIYQIVQSNDIGNSSRAEPNSLVVLGIVAFRVTTMVPPLLFSLILEFDLLVLLTKAALQKSP
jgi:hypothetical protein